MLTEAGFITSWGYTDKYCFSQVIGRIWSGSKLSKEAPWRKKDHACTLEKEELWPRTEVGHGVLGRNSTLGEGKWWECPWEFSRQRREQVYWVHDKSGDVRNNTELTSWKTTLPKSFRWTYQESWLLGFFIHRKIRNQWKSFFFNWW